MVLIAFPATVPEKVPDVEVIVQACMVEVPETVVFTVLLLIAWALAIPENNPNTKSKILKLVKFFIVSNFNILNNCSLILLYKDISNIYEFTNIQQHNYMIYILISNFNIISTKKASIFINTLGIFDNT